MDNNPPAVSGRFQFIQTESVHVVYNPRRYFDAAQHAELVASIKERGVIQPILVRTNPDETVGGYLLISGERRLRAVKEATSNGGVIPAYIREMTAEEAVAAAADENENRQDVSETEQADAAVRLLKVYNDDRAETARRLGWSLSKLERRLALSRLSESSKNALDSRRIMLGHAEILAAIPFSKQETALKTILDNALTVTATRDLLEKMTHQLKAATFDLTECATCPFNSSLQRTLFSTTVHDGACTNRTCYDLKTERAAAEALVAQQQPSSAGSQDAASETGDNNQPGATDEDGNTDTDTAVAEDGADTAESPDTETAGQPRDTVGTRTTSTPRTPTATDAAPAASGKNDASELIKSTASKATSLREKAWRRSLAIHLSENHDAAMRFLMTCVYSVHGGTLSNTTARSKAKALLGDAFAGKSFPEAFAAISALPREEADRALRAIAGGLAMDVERFDRISSTAKTLGLDINQTWRIDKLFLGLFTKEELKHIAVECGVVDVIGAKPFSRLYAGKRSDLIAAMLSAEGFSWTGITPRCMSISGKPIFPSKTATSASTPSSPSRKKTDTTKPRSASETAQASDVVPATTQEAAVQLDAVS